jgi:hypothetical protein
MQRRRQSEVINKSYFQNTNRTQPVGYRQALERVDETTPVGSSSRVCLHDRTLM